MSYIFLTDLSFREISTLKIYRSIYGTRKYRRLYAAKVFRTLTMMLQNIQYTHS